VFNLAFKDLYAKQDVFSKSLVVKWDGRVLPSQGEIFIQNCSAVFKIIGCENGMAGFSSSP